MRRKVFRSGKFLGERAGRACIMAVVTEPLDWLWHRIQHLDEASCALVHIGNRSLNPFRAAQVVWLARNLPGHL